MTKKIISLFHPGFCCLVYPTEPSISAAPIKVEKIKHELIINENVAAGTTTKTFTVSQSMKDCRVALPAASTTAITNVRADITAKDGTTRSITAELKPREQAKKDFDEAVSAGKQAVLTTTTNSGADVEWRFGNVNEGDLVVLKATFVGEARVQGGSQQVALPLAHGTKYGSTYTPSAPSTRDTAIPTEVSVRFLSSNFDWQAVALSKEATNVRVTSPSIKPAGEASSLEDAAAALWGGEPSDGSLQPKVEKDEDGKPREVYVLPASCSDVKVACAATTATANFSYDKPRTLVLSGGLKPKREVSGQVYPSSYTIPLPSDADSVQRIRDALQLEPSAEVPSHVVVSALTAMHTDMLEGADAGPSGARHLNLVLDYSGSMSGARASQLRRALESVLHFMSAVDMKGIHLSATLFGTSWVYAEIDTAKMKAAAAGSSKAVRLEAPLRTQWLRMWRSLAAACFGASDLHSDSSALLLGGRPKGKRMSDMVSKNIKAAAEGISSFLAAPPSEAEGGAAALPTSVKLSGKTKTNETYDVKAAASDVGKALSSFPLAVSSSPSVEDIDKWLLQHCETTIMLRRMFPLTDSSRTSFNEALAGAKHLGGTHLFDTVAGAATRGRVLEQLFTGEVTSTAASGAAEEEKDEDMGKEGDGAMRGTMLVATDAEVKLNNARQQLETFLTVFPSQMNAFVVGIQCEEHELRGLASLIDAPYAVTNMTGMTSAEVERDLEAISDGVIACLQDERIMVDGVGSAMVIPPTYLSLPPAAVMLPRADTVIAQFVRLPPPPAGTAMPSVRVRARVGTRDVSHDSALLSAESPLARAYGVLAGRKLHRLKDVVEALADTKGRYSGSSVWGYEARRILALRPGWRIYAEEDAALKSEEATEMLFHYLGAATGFVGETKDQVRPATSSSLGVIDYAFSTGPPVSAMSRSRGMRFTDTRSDESSRPTPMMQFAVNTPLFASMDQPVGASHFAPKAAMTKSRKKAAAGPPPVARAPAFAPRNASPWQAPGGAGGGWGVASGGLAMPEGRAAAVDDFAGFSFSGAAADNAPSDLLDLENAMNDEDDASDASSNSDVNLKKNAAPAPALRDLFDALNSSTLRWDPSNRAVANFLAYYNLGTPADADEATKTIATFLQNSPPTPLSRMYKIMLERVVKSLSA